MKNDAGFSMLELMIAILILLVGIVAVAKMVPQALRTDLNNRNDSTGLVAAQQLVQEMRGVGLAPTGTSLDSSFTSCTQPTGDYWFCDEDGNPIAFGTETVPSTLPGITSNGCPVNSEGNLDFTQASSNCDSGYYVTEAATWNPTTGTQVKTQLRWRVITFWNSGGSPYRKILIVGGSSGGSGTAVSTGQAFSFNIASLQTVVSK